MNDHAKTSAAQTRKGRKFVSRAANVHIYTQNNQPAIGLGYEAGRHITLVDSNTGHEVTMDDTMFDFIAKMVRGEA